MGSSCLPFAFGGFGEPVPMAWYPAKSDMVAARGCCGGFDGRDDSRRVRRVAEEQRGTEWYYKMTISRGGHAGVNVCTGEGTDLEEPRLMICLFSRPLLPSKERVRARFHMQERDKGPFTRVSPADSECFRRGTVWSVLSRATVYTDDLLCSSNGTKPSYQ